MTRKELAGILLVNKPTGISSAGAVAVVKRVLGGAKVGHLGTLDPFASGLLPLCIGEGTKAAPYLNTADKSYLGVVRLGTTTDTLDVTGNVTATAAPPPMDSLELETLARRFVGTISQVPPAFSALKRNGVPMYKLARKGVAPALAPREVTIHSLALSVAGEDRLRVEVACSKGTYVRSLARDIGEVVGCGAVLESLERTAFGGFALDRAIALAPLQAAGGAELARDATIALADALAHLPALAVDEDVAARLRSGQQAALARLEPPPDEPVHTRVLDPCGALVAVLSATGGRWKLDRVFGAAAPCAPQRRVLKADG